MLRDNSCNIINEVQLLVEIVEGFEIWKKPNELIIIGTKYRHYDPNSKGGGV